MSRVSFSSVHQSTDEEDNNHGLTNQERYKYIIMGLLVNCKEKKNTFGILNNKHTVHTIFTVWKIYMNGNDELSLTFSTVQSVSSGSLSIQISVI